jgi:hypothetical protein
LEQAFRFPPRQALLTFIVTRDALGFFTLKSPNVQSFDYMERKAVHASVGAALVPLRGGNVEALALDSDVLSQCFDDRCIPTLMEVHREEPRLCPAQAFVSQPVMGREPVLILAQ